MPNDGTPPDETRPQTATCLPPGIGPSNSISSSNLAPPSSRQRSHADTVPSCLIPVCPTCNIAVTKTPEIVEVNRRSDSSRGGYITQPPAMVIPRDGNQYYCCDDGAPSTTPHGGEPQTPDTVTSPSQAKSATTSQTYILKVCRALIMFGAPSHRLERYVHHTGQALGLNIQSFYMPGCMMVSFDNRPHVAVDFQIVRCDQALNLAKLYDVHAVYKDVIHNRSTVEAACNELDKIIQKGDKYALWIRVLAYGLASASIGPVSYNAQPVDLPIIFILGSLIGLLELVVVPRSELYGYVFEISVAIMASFLGRAFGSIRWGQGHSFCFSAISQASIVMILPGFTITNSAVELQSKNMVSGAVRIVYGIVYTLFLAFGFTVGITIYGAIDGAATSATQCSTAFGVWWPIAFVLPFSFGYIIVNKGSWSRMPAMLAISMAGWAVNHFSGRAFEAVPPLSQALGALTVGVLANAYSRIEHGVAAALMHPAIYIQVPGSLAASGSFISGLANADQLTRNGTSTASSRQAAFSQLDAGYTMVEIAIGITVGLSVSVLLIYPLRRKARSGIFSF